jgi:RNA polymerase sigma-70 factor (ECF subfamily)
VTDGDIDRIEALSTPRVTVVGRPVDAAGRVALEAWEAHHRDLYAFARAAVREPATAEDVVAEAYLRLIRELRHDRPPSDVRGWLFRVTANLVVSKGRRRAVASRMLHRLVRRDVGEAADAPTLRAERDRELLTALGVLPADHRTAVLLAAAGYSGREIAAAIGRSEPAVRTLLSRARLRLREQLERLEPREGGS